METAAALALVQGILALVPAALSTYGEIRGTLDAKTQADVDALIAQIKPEALAAVAQAEADLDTAARAS
jgi:hypothetical protein